MRRAAANPACAPAGLLAVLAVGGCSLNQFTVNSTAPVIHDGLVALDRESDVQFARDAAPGNLLTVETFLVTSPDNRHLLEVLAQGYAQYAFAFLEDDLEALGDAGDPQRRQALRQALIDRCTTFYDRSYARALHLAEVRHPEVGNALARDGGAVSEALLRFTSNADGVPLYWMGLSLASSINLHKDDLDRVAGLPRAIALLERAHAIAPSYAVHGAALALGVVYGSQGRAMGGDPERSRKMFDEVLSATDGRYLMAKAVMARTLVTVLQDRALYEKTLREVLAAAPDLWPDQRLANELARRRATRYLALADDLFLPPEPPASMPKATR